MTDNKIIIIFGLIVFYVFFGFLYGAIGSTMYEYQGSDTYTLEYATATDGTAYKVLVKPVINDETEGLLSKIIKGYAGQDLEYINYIFIILTAMIIFLIIITVLHG
jgi:hypothetical protein